MKTSRSSIRVRRPGAPWVLVLVLSVAGCSGSGKAHIEATQQTLPGPAIINVVRVIRQPVDVTLSMPGELDPYETVAVYPKVTGFIDTIRVDRGSRVHAGELIATLEAPEFLSQRAEAQSKLQAAEAQLAVARSRTDASTSTYDGLKAAAATPGVVAGNDLVLAEKTVEADQGQIAAAQQTTEAARQALRSIAQMEAYLRVTAPFDGVVTERNVHPGALVGPNSGSGGTRPMVRIVTTDRLRLTVPVPEAYVAGVMNGAVVSFTVPAYPGRTFTGTIARVAHDIDIKTRTMAVEMDVMNKDGVLASGTFCQVRWPIHRPTPSLFVPAGSVASTTDRTFVVRVRDGKTEWVDVRVGLASGPLAEVFGDLQAGDFVATRGTDEIKPATQVQVKEVKPAIS
jgi:membrane fusion protein, multidrug efflux system